MDASTLQLIILPAGLIAVLFALYLARDVLRRDAGTKEMQDVAGTIYEGAVAFIRRQYSTIAIFALIGAVVITAVISALVTPQVADTRFNGFDLGWRTGIAFLVGAACSMASGIIGMFVAVKANVRTASAARRSLVEAVQVAMRGGAVSGFLVVSLSLLGVYLIFVIFGGFTHPE
ncbi:MAG TPA: sodium/proton-translocating pyrophosphatase, partial [Candidatus Limnocylindrales bacterium]